MCWPRATILLVLSLLLLSAAAEDDFESFGEMEEALQFDDSPQLRDTAYPDWFKLSFLDLSEDLAEAVAEDKRGIMVYFGQQHCAYCKALIEVNFGKDDIVAYTRRHFDLIPIDIWGDRELVTLDHEVMTEKQFAERERTQFTPSIIFYDSDGVNWVRSLSANLFSVIISLSRVTSSRSPQMSMGIRSKCLRV